MTKVAVLRSGHAPPYCAGTDAGGRIEDRDVRVAADDGFAAAARDRPRCGLSTDSR